MYKSFILAFILVCSVSVSFEVETSTVAAINQTTDLGAALSIGDKLPDSWWVVGGHKVFADFMKAGDEEAVGLSISFKKHFDDDGWRIGAVITRPDKPTRDVTWYTRFVLLRF
jgi:hypothetical protein